MFGFLKNLLRKSQENPAVGDDAPAGYEAAQEFSPEPAAAAPSSAARAQGRPALGQNGKGVEISVQNILTGLPLELQPRVRQADVGGLTITVPLDKVLAQLSRGAVKISFGELRQAVPDVFTAENDRDRVLVSLPLNDVLSHLNPALITRRRVQRQVEVPADISSPFDAEGRGLVFSVGPEGAAPAAAPSRQAAHSPAAPAAPVAPGSPFAPGRAVKPATPASPVNGGTSHTTRTARTPAAHGPAATPPQAAPPAVAFRQKLSPATPAAPAPLPMPAAPAAQPAPVAPAPVPFKVVRPAVAREHSNGAPKPAAPAPAPAHAPVPAAPAPAPIPFVAAPVAAAPVAPVAPAPIPMPAAPAPSAPAAKPGKEAEPLVVSLTALAEGFPDAVRKDIVALKLVDAKVGLPFSSVEQGLKQGRVAVSWKTLRSCIKPAVPQTASAQDSVVLELPLKVVAPLFLARQQEHGQHQKVAVDEDIPNLFFGYPRPEGPVPVAAATARPADTNFYVWDENSDTARVDATDVKQAPPSPGTKFVAKYATPNEVVSRAAGMEGVTGALIALPDGLMVANRLPAELNADTLAAFLPAIFGKVSQCTKELRMGELNNLNFTVGNIPWKIFRVNSIFFAAFGKAGEPLPTAQLAALAAELDHKAK